MRWSNLLTEEDAAARLPGYREPPVVRTFDAPEALDMRFYEVQARSALNRVPESSAVPFRWTINPYRGCSHACVYCASGDTQILMADGRSKALAELRVGERIYGTVREGSNRRLTATEVLAHWRSVKPAYRVVLDDGTELITSGDHRFLTSRGWKHVTGSDQGPERRPHLTLASKLMGVGVLPAPPEHNADYRRGYLCGVIRGDGHIEHYLSRRADHPDPDRHLRSPLALADLEALRRARDFLDQVGVAANDFSFAAAGGARRAMTAIRSYSAAAVTAVEEVVEWPDRPTQDWHRGFLAGMFDAEGSYLHGILRISNTDFHLLARVRDSLRALGLPSVLERTGRENGLCTVRVPGGLVNHLRFFHATDPAITRKRTIDGAALKTRAQLGVGSIEPLGLEMPLYDITTGTGDFIANGVVSHNCFARPTHRYLDFDAGRDFEREIVVKVNVPELVRKELNRPSWKGEHVAMGTNTDPYQWVEARYKLMPPIWEAMRDFANPCSILTKSPLLLRDLPLLQEVAQRAPVSAAFSVPTLDEKAWRATEPHTPNPRARLEAVGELNRAGIPTGILIAPLMPGINDAPEQVEPILELAAEMGATSVSGIALHLRGEVRDVFMGWLRDQRPDLVPRYEELYARGAYAPQEERRRLARIVKGVDRSPAWRGRNFGLAAGSVEMHERFRRNGQPGLDRAASEVARGEPAPREGAAGRPRGSAEPPQDPRAAPAQGRLF